MEAGCLANVNPSLERGYYQSNQRSSLAVADCRGFLFMATITDLTTQKRDRDRINVYLDGQFAFGLAAFVAAELKVGQQLSQGEIESLKLKDQVAKAKNNALRLVSMRPRSVFEIQTRLRRKSFEEATIDEVVKQLLALDLLNDAAFVDYWIEQRETFRPRSRFALGQELRQKGISRELIDVALEQVDELAAARRAAEKRAAKWAGLPEPAFREKMGRFLQRRGFSYEIINETLDATWQAIDE